MKQFVKADRNTQVGKPRPFHLTSTEIIGISSIMEALTRKHYMSV